MKKLVSLLLLLLPLSFFAVDSTATATQKSAIFVGSVACLVVIYYVKMVLVNPWQIRRKLREQGIDGPKPSIVYGNLWEMQRIQAVKKSSTSINGAEFVAHDYTSTLFPYFEQWRKQFGPVYMYSTGNKQHLYVNHPNLVKEMNQCPTQDLGKPSYVTKRLAPLLGNGILRSNGHLWAQQRKILSSEFFMDKVKGMVGLMVESTDTLTRKWEGFVESESGKVVEVKAEEDLRSVSADMISKACFGSSYLKGKDIFSKLRTLQKAITKQSFLFSNHAFRLLPTGQQKKIESLEKEIDTLIWEVVREREEECRGAGNKDLLQLLLEGAINDNVDKNSSKSFIVDNCKNIYFAGHESTAVAASWCLILLALHPEWQDKIRDEMSRVCGSKNGKIDADSLPKLKTVNIVIQEVMRLYPPAAFVSREALQDTQIGHIAVPKGMCIWTLIPTLHRDVDIWGPDANEFKPERFANGISGACKFPQVYIPFGLGPRVCLGKNFALVQLKIVVALIVSNFCFTLSPKYKHSPAYRMIVEPGQGVHLLVQKCQK